MTQHDAHERSADDIVRAWIESGPDLAARSLIDRTMQPIPLMRQRRSIWIGLGRPLRLASIGGPAAVVVTTAIVAIVGFGILVGRPGPGIFPEPTVSPSPLALRPSFTLVMGAGAAEQTFASDPAAGLATCGGVPGGPWYALYGGGDPFVSLDVIAGQGAGDAGGENRVAAEIEAGDLYVRFDPAILRGGDAAGRSSASVDVTTDGDATTFEITATTPDRSTGEDGPPMPVSLTLTCAPAP